MVNQDIVAAVFGVVGILSLVFIAKKVKDEITYRDNDRNSSVQNVAEFRESIPTATYDSGNMSDLPTANEIPFSVASRGGKLRKTKKRRKSKKRT
jgi:hypothetical protein